MTGYPGAEQYLPRGGSLTTLARAAAGCRGCDLYARATQTVFGQGSADARLLLVGEQPGDREDIEGAPFVGPAGRLLDRALGDAGLAEVPTWRTNAVKHFRWKPGRGKRRLHDKPTAAQTAACRPWLAAELAAVQPDAVVALGATAAGSLFGSGFRLTAHRGEPLPWPPERGAFADSELAVGHVFATVHPSAVLRAPDDERADAMRRFVDDLRAVAAALG